MDKKTTKQINAIDALAKVRALLAAATYLTANSKEKELMCELMHTAEEVATRVLEGDNHHD